jgi:sulfur-carrier protein adenylyltransferase/sulfurtransferase
MDHHSKHNRYQRQILLKEFGESGQEKLRQAKVLVIGAGGLACPALQYLAAAGIGYLGILDFDVVEESNLHRQILYNSDDIGKPKAEIAAKKIKALNPYVQTEVFNLKINNSNALSIIQSFDVISDGSDNFSTRYLVNDACVILNKPLVYGAVLRFEGQLAVFNVEDQETHVKTNYRDLFPEINLSNTHLSCKDLGVLGVMPGLIGILQATEVIKLITGIGKPLVNKILSYNALSNHFYDLELSPANNTSYPKTKEEFESYDYELNCLVASSSNEISTEEFENARKEHNVLIIDVREAGELPLVTEFEHIRLPLSQLQEKANAISAKDKIILFCNSGQRSLKAQSILKNVFPTQTSFSLEGGIIAWKQSQKILI